jgi:hypothetical protein
MMRRVVVIAGLLLAACYRYTPMSGPLPDAGSSIRVDLTDAGAVQLAPAIGQRIESLDGRSVAVSDSAVALAVSATISQAGVVAHWNNERVDIPRSAISRIRGRALDTRRTIVVSGLAVTGVFLVGQLFGLDLGSGLFGSGRPGGSKQ